jgi:hypothetical protein
MKAPEQNDWAAAMAALRERMQPICPNNSRHGAALPDPKGGASCQTCSAQRGRHARRWL